MNRSRRRRAANRAGRELEKLLLVLGLLAITMWVGSIIRIKVSQDWSNWAFDRKTHDETVTLRDYVESWFTRKPPAPAANVPPPRQPATPPPTIATGDLIGRLEIPRLNLQAMVREGAGARTLDTALGHIPGTALPWQNGNVGVAGHRDSLFRGLGRIRKTDQIEIQTVNGTYVYEVESTNIVKPQKVSVLDPGPYPEITLVTCYPFHYIGSAPERFIVKARQISTPETASAEPKKTEASTAITAADHPPPRAPERPVQRPSQRKVYFQLSAGHSRTLVPGVSLGLDRADPASQNVNGWMWVMPDRRTIWIRRQRPHEPVVFYGHQDGKRRELVITRIARDSVSGYLELFGG